MLVKNNIQMSRRDVIIVALIMVLVIIAWIVDSVRKIDNINSDMHVVATMVAKDLNPNLYLRDVNYSTNELYRFYTPAYRWLVGWLWQVTGEFEWGLVWLTPFVLGAYMIGMYLLLLWVTENPWIALGVTIASAGYYETMGEEIWGSGRSTLMLARTLFTATVPYLTLLILDVWQRLNWSKMIVLGLGLGLAANLHPPSGMHLTVIVIGMLILLYGFRSGWLRFWLKLGVMILASLVGVWPTLVNYVRGTTETDLVGVDFKTLYRIVSEWYDMPFRPLEIKFRSLGLVVAQSQLEVMFWIGLGAGVLALGLYFLVVPRRPGLKRWFWLVGGLLTIWYAFIVALFNLIIIFALVALYVIYRFYRGPITRLDSMLVGWTALIVAQSFIGYYLIVKLWEYSELVSLTTLVGEQPRAARFIYLPIYLLVGLSVVALVREIANRWPVNERGETGLSVSAGLMVAVAPGLSQVISRDLSRGLIGLLVGLIFVAVLAWWTTNRKELAGWRGTIIGLGGVVIVLFGPLAPVLSPYLHIPAVNVFDPTAMTPELAFKAHDQALYDWAKTKTEQDTLFFWCDFGPITTLHFRLKAERSLTHHWRDLNQRTYNPGTLPVHHERYRQFERACLNLFSTVAAAQEAGADFILIPSRLAAEFETESCFFNERYAVFPVSPRLCPDS